MLGIRRTDLIYFALAQLPAHVGAIVGSVEPEFRIAYDMKYILNSELEDDMGASAGMTIFFQLMVGLGIFFIGVGVLWFVDVYKKKG